jgi:hypothetical protein
MQATVATVKSSNLEVQLPLVQMLGLDDQWSRSRRTMRSDETRTALLTMSKEQAERGRMQATVATVKSSNLEVQLPLVQMLGLDDQWSRSRRTMRSDETRTALLTTSKE